MTDVNKVTYESVQGQLLTCLKAPSPLATEHAYAVLSRGLKFLDYTAHLLRCLQVTIRDANFAKTPVVPFYDVVMKLLEEALPLNMTKAFMGEQPPGKSEQAKRTRLPALRHSLTETWSRLFEKELPDDLLLDALVRLGDGQVEKMTETRLLAPYVTSVFDPPSGDVAVPASWSRATARALLSVIHHGGLNFDRLYPRLYQLLDDDLLACPFAERFFIDLDTYLSSLHLSAACVASFAKRLAQLSLTSPALWTLPALMTAMANCLNRHHACRVLVGGGPTAAEQNPTASSSSPPAKRRRLGNGEMQKEDREEETNDDAFRGDPYTYSPGRDFDESGALESSLWELACLERHYHPEIVSLAQRIRQIASAGTSADHLPEMKNQVALGKQMSGMAKKRAEQQLAILQMTNARIPNLPPLKGWSSGVLEPPEQVKTLS